jgi:HK97 family phage prohead protease
MTIERRFSKGAEVRAVGDAAVTLKIGGYAAVFNEDFVLYEDSSYRVVERIAPGAFTDVMSDDVRCLFNHQPDHVLGRTGNGTLNLMQDDKGLAFNNDMDADTRIGRDVYQFVKRGDVTGCSFAFIVSKSTWTEEDTDGVTNVARTIEKISSLYDVGPVTYPAYEQTNVDARLLELRSAQGPFADMPADLVSRIRAGKPALTLAQRCPLLVLQTEFISRD